MTLARVTSLPVSQRRLIALALLLMSALLFVVLVAWPVAALIASQSEWRTGATERLGRYQSLAADRAKIEEQLQQAQTHALWNALLPGTDAAAATSVLQSEVRGLLDAQRIAVQVSAPIDAKAGKHVTAVGVRLNIDLSIDQLERLLAGVQAHGHRFVLDNVRVTAPQYQSPDQNPVLNVQMEVWGFMRSAAQPAPGAGNQQLSASLGGTS